MAKPILLPKPQIPFVDKQGNVSNEWRRWLEAGGAIFEGKAKLPVGALPDGVVPDPNANGRLYLAADGDVVSFGGTFGTIPRRIEPDVSGLPSLAAGLAYDIKAINASATGFTAYAKTVTPTGNTTYNSGAGTNAGGTPQWTAQKPNAADATNQAYSFTFNGTIPLISREYLGGSYFNEYEGFFTPYAYVSGAWVSFSDVLVNWSEESSVYSSSYTLTGYVLNAIITQAIGLAGGSQAEFGLHPGTGSTITSLTNVGYQVQTLGSPTTIGTQKLKWWVYP